VRDIMRTASNAEMSIDNAVRNHVAEMNAAKKTVAKDPIIKNAGSSLLEVSAAIANKFAKAKLAKPQLPCSTPSN
jgi:hypothetical protein